jgi:RNA polymerase sigma-70 factor (ECF subfamily)
MAAAPLLDFAAMDGFRAAVEKERAYLLRFARLQLRDRDAAEDAVQDALLAALGGEAAFSGRSNLRTWLTGILKHKIVDYIRRAAREAPLAGGDEEPAEFDALFDERGHWRDSPGSWSDPDAALEQREFFARLEECLAKLPAKTARTFMMREHLGCDTGEICKELGLTPTHLWVLIYRARMALRGCLQENWFGK